MKKIISRLLYTLFFGFSLTLLISCVLLLINNMSSELSGNGIAAVRINESGLVSVYDRVEEVSLAAGSTITETDCERGYNTLTTPEERELYRSLELAVYNISKEPDEQGRYTTERIRLKGASVEEYRLRHALNAFLFDNPQIFWLDNVFGFVHSGDDTVVECYSELSADQCKYMIAEFSDKIDELLSDITPDMNAYARERLIHDRLLAGCRYADEVKAFSDDWHCFCAYGAIVDGNAVCEGYAKAFQLLMMRAGVECCTIRGQGDGVAHMWNVICFSGTWYHIDTTWDDTGDFINYEYFNVDDENICRNHIIAEAMGKNDVADAKETESRNFFVPECSSMALNYYNVEGIRLSEFSAKSDAEMIAFITDRVRSGQTMIPVTIAGSLNYTECVEKMFYKSPYRFYYYIDQANESLDDAHKIDKNKIKILRNEQNRTLRVRISLG